MSDEWQKHTEAEDSLEGRLDTYSNSYKGIQMSRSMLILEQVKHISQVNVHAWNAYSQRQILLISRGF